MTILNLDPNFQPFGAGIQFKDFIFPSKCEVHIKLSGYNYEKIKITTRIKSSDDIMKLLMCTDALKRSGVNHIELFMPFVPYARQDRQMVKGEPLSIKVFADLIDSQGYKKVTVYDIHSEVAPALINNCEALDNHSFVDKVIANRLEEYLIISPDAGAYKKIFRLCQHLQYKGEIIMCNKLRDTTNGVLRSVTVSHDDLQGKECFIVDDICDGGGSFNLLAEELRKRNSGNINLIVSHGIFSAGEDELHKHLNRIYTTDSFQDIQSTFIKQIKLKDIL